MKKISAIIPLLLFVFGNSGCGTSAPDLNSISADSMNTKQAPDSIPHEVRHGKAASYAYIPDVSIQQIVLGNASSFSRFYRENGANINEMGNGHTAIAYFNLDKTEEIQLLLTKSKKNENVPYAITVQKYGDAGSPLLAKNPFTTAEKNYVSGNGIYIGMTPDYVLAVYTDQVLMQSVKGDTVVLKYNPKKKDEKNYQLFSMNSYSATYKFVDDHLCRMEYTVDPKEFEK